MREYELRKFIPITHDQYLDEPVDAVEWMIRIHALEAAHKPSGSAPDAANRPA